MDAHRLSEAQALLRALAEAASADPALAERVRDLLAASGVLAVFGAGEALDVVDLLDAGGEGALRARLRELPIAELRLIIAARDYDPDKRSARWRAGKLVDLITEGARRQLDAENRAAHPNPAAAWML